MSSGDWTSLEHFPNPNVKLKKLYLKKFLIFFCKKIIVPQDRNDVDQAVKLYLYFGMNVYQANFSNSSINYIFGLA